jgi:hypothetical protein
MPEITKIYYNWNCFGLNNFSYNIHHQNCEPWTPHSDLHPIPWTSLPGLVDYSHPVAAQPHLIPQEETMEASLPTHSEVLFHKRYHPHCSTYHHKNTEGPEASLSNLNTILKTTMCDYSQQQSPAATSQSLCVNLQVIKSSEDEIFTQFHLPCVLWGPTMVFHPSSPILIFTCSI